MRLGVPDPDYTSSARSQRNFGMAVKVATGFIVVVWAVFLGCWLFGINPGQWGVIPRSGYGVTGILTAPLMHGGFGHIISNTAPLWVLTIAMLYAYPNSSLRVFPAVWIGSGIIVWLVARPASHIGASGLVYGLAAYVFLAGLLRRDIRSISISLLVYFLYGTLAWGVFPIRAGMSFESHAAGAVVGIGMAIWLRRLDQVPRKRYDWEDED